MPRSIEQKSGVRLDWYSGGGSAQISHPCGRELYSLVNCDKHCANGRRDLVFCGQVKFLTEFRLIGSACFSGADNSTLLFWVSLRGLCNPHISCLWGI